MQVSPYVFQMTLDTDQTRPTNQSSEKSHPLAFSILRDGKTLGSGKGVDEAGGIYHALKRGNARATLFDKPEDYGAFERIVAGGLSVIHARSSPTS